MVPPWFRADSGTNLIKQGGAGGGCKRSTKWLKCSVVSRIARGRGFQSRSGHGFSSPVTCMIFKALGGIALYFHIKCDLVVYIEDLTLVVYSRARAYCACSRCGWGLFGHFYSHLSFLSSFSLSLGDGPI